MTAPRSLDGILLGKLPDPHGSSFGKQTITRQLLQITSAQHQLHRYRGWFPPGHTVGTPPLPATKMQKLLTSGLSRPPISRQRYGLLTVLLLVGLWMISRSSDSIIDAESRFSFSPFRTHSELHHPIDDLIYDAQHKFAALTSEKSDTVEEAAQQYRKKRGRHPPPHFDKWFEFAKSHNALIVEGFFDQIYHDLEPFWGVEPGPMRREASQYEMTINVRNGTAKSGSDWPWTVTWLNLTKSIEHLLPDMDIALNAMDEPRLVVPWEKIDEYMKAASKTSKLAPSSMMDKEFSNWPDPKTGDLAGKALPKHWDSEKFYWKLARTGCPPDSLARKADLQTSFENPPRIDNQYAESHLYQGYVANYTKSTQICHQPDLQGLEGILIQPLSTSTTTVLFPMFGGSKLAVNNEILLPAPVYWKEEERFTGGGNSGIAWAKKDNKVTWRGVATGGFQTANNWRGFQRQRFVAMNNGTKISHLESGEGTPENFYLPADEYGVLATKNHKLAEWVDGFADAGFIDLFCHNEVEEGKCEHFSHYFERVEGVGLVQMFDGKFLPDVDGNSFSGRYLAFLRSTSLPIKATLWREWHDSRLVPWKHFVPMDNRYTDYYGIMDYFLGYKGRNGHDKAAEKIANDGKDWAAKVLRKEDMQIYVLRLLLEYARVMDDDREKMGWVDDALKDEKLEETWLSWRSP